MPEARSVQDSNKARVRASFDQWAKARMGCAPYFVARRFSADGNAFIAESTLVDAFEFN